VHARHPQRVEQPDHVLDQALDRQWLILARDFRGTVAAQVQADRGEFPRQRGQPAEPAAAPTIWCG
jgi:hypothetical protein